MAESTDAIHRREAKGSGAQSLNRLLTRMARG